MHEERYQHTEDTITIHVCAVLKSHHHCYSKLPLDSKQNIYNCNQYMVCRELFVSCQERLYKYMYMCDFFPDICFSSLS